MESDFGRKIAETVPVDSPWDGRHGGCCLHFQVALPRLDDVAETTPPASATPSPPWPTQLRGAWSGPVAPPVRLDCPTG